MRRLLAVFAVCVLIVAAACGEEGADNEENDVAASEDCDTSEQTLDGGLKVQDIRCGDGIEAEVGDNIRVHYEGRLEDGTVFDSSYETGDPVQFLLDPNSLIQGWVDGIPGMKVGGKRKLIIPPNATLIFEIELLNVKEGPGT